STTIADENGNRDIGTKASSEVSEVVLENGELYQGEADVLGVNHISEYRPIKNEDGEVVGMWFVGYPTSSVSQMTNSFITMLIIIIAILVLVSVLVTTLFTR